MNLRMELTLVIGASRSPEKDRSGASSLPQDCGTLLSVVTTLLDRALLWACGYVYASLHILHCPSLIRQFIQDPSYHTRGLHSVPQFYASS